MYLMWWWWWWWRWRRQSNDGDWSDRGNVARVAAEGMAIAGLGDGVD